MGIYAPNAGPTVFWEHVKNKHSKDFNKGIIVLGDLNAIMDREFDCSRCTKIAVVPFFF